MGVKLIFIHLNRKRYRYPRSYRRFKDRVAEGGHDEKQPERVNIGEEETPETLLVGVEG